MADVYDAITADRPYQPANAPHVAVKAIRDGAGTQFDPQIVEHFLRIAMPYPVGYTITLPDGSSGAVVGVEPEEPEYPVIRYREGGTFVESALHIVDGVVQAGKGRRRRVSRRARPGSGRPVARRAIRRLNARSDAERCTHGRRWIWREPSELNGIQSDYGESMPMRKVKLIAGFVTALALATAGPAAANILPTATWPLNEGSAQWSTTRHSTETPERSQGTGATWTTVRFGRRWHLMQRRRRHRLRRLHAGAGQEHHRQRMAKASSSPGNFDYIVDKAPQAV